MKVNLSCGTFLVKVWFDQSKTGRLTGMRTSLYLLPEDGTRPSPFATVVCHKNDAFSKREGRKRVLSRFFETENVLKMTKEDRTILWKAVCPFFFPKAEQKFDLFMVAPKGWNFERMAKAFKGRRDKKNVTGFIFNDICISDLFDEKSVEDLMTEYNKRRGG